MNIKCTVSIRFHKLDISDPPSYIFLSKYLKKPNLINYTITNIHSSNLSNYRIQTERKTDREIERSDRCYHTGSHLISYRDTPRISLFIQRLTTHKRDNLHNEKKKNGSLNL